MKRLFYFLLAASLILSSCNMPSSGAPSPDVATAAAMTVQAAVGNNQSPLASPTAGIDSGQQTTPTADGGKPFASFEDVTNCRTGPGVNYERVTQIQPGFAVEIIGYFAPNYWIVSTDKGPCWVAGEFVTPSGSVSAVPTVTAPPTPKGGAPQNVSLQKWDILCNYTTNEANVTVAWSDKEDETGYRVVRNDVVIAELPADSTEFKETITLLSGQTVGYSIIAFNAIGDTQSKTIALSC
ncbi:MAG: hypothetical protein HYU84_12185 [Chloroflexi bacterium]|nr:hypothetical protein [Chloroflexota bacterium]